MILTTRGNKDRSAGIEDDVDEGGEDKLYVGAELGFVFIAKRPFSPFVLFLSLILIIVLIDY